MFTIVLLESGITLFFATSEAYIEAKNSLLLRGVDFE